MRSSPRGVAVTLSNAAELKELGVVELLGAGATTSESVDFIAARCSLTVRDVSPGNSGLA